MSANQRAIYARKGCVHDHNMDPPRHPSPVPRATNNPQPGWRVDAAWPPSGSLGHNHFGGLAFDAVLRPDRAAAFSVFAPSNGRPSLDPSRVPRGFSLCLSGMGYVMRGKRMEDPRGYRVQPMCHGWNIFALETRASGSILSRNPKVAGWPR